MSRTSSYERRLPMSIRSKACLEGLRLRRDVLRLQMPVEPLQDDLEAHRPVGRLPERESSWDSAGKRTSSTSRFIARSVANNSSPWPIGHRRSSSEGTIRNGVVMSFA